MKNQEILSLKPFLDEKAEQYNQLQFIETDPIQIPHRFSGKENIEIAGFLSAAIAWGNRRSIIKSAEKMLEWLEYSPYDFILNHSEKDLQKIQGSIHRTFNAEDLKFFIKSLKNIYLNHNGLENVFSAQKDETDTFGAIERFRRIFFEIPHPERTPKHVSSPAKGSAAKRLNMFLRWLVRKDQKNVDFGIWNSLSPAQLVCPLDVHSGRVARSLGLLERKQNDRKAVLELTQNLKLLDENDPAKYDFALFGLGVFEKF
ncbi:MAG: TIGR02757 family protein [Flavobacteriaceae bacterium]|jgi:uncharacterized protein (TIGR02757 family)|nr:TIGR02757 family protein [Flavobacteriaceae bacterium]